MLAEVRKLDFLLLTVSGSTDFGLLEMVLSSTPAVRSGVKVLCLAWSLSGGESGERAGEASLVEKVTYQVETEVWIVWRVVVVLSWVVTIEGIMSETHQHQVRGVLRHESPGPGLVWRD